MQDLASVTVSQKSASAPLRVRLRPFHIHFYQVCDSFTGFLICAMAVFSPWAFGTTQPWSIWTMNIAGYALGVLLCIKELIRLFAGYVPARLDLPQIGKGSTQVMAVATVLLLGYVLLSALNGRATYHSGDSSLSYHNSLSWLPQSLDTARTWQAFGNYLALACCFWATRDWLLTQAPGRERFHYPVPQRLQLLLWVLAVNGAALSLEGIAQRWEGSGKLLFILQPRVNPGAEAQFGPWAYRGTAASYFNLLWPVCLGFWARRQQLPKEDSLRGHLLLLCVTVIALAPVASSSRGGAVVTSVLLTGIGLFAFWNHQRSRGGAGSSHAKACGAAALSPRRTFISRPGIRLMWIFLLTVPLLGVIVGAKSLLPRLAEFHTGLQLREQMNTSALPMAGDYPLFGTGPGTFETVFQFYRLSPETDWPAQLHNDWLETRITFGWAGCSLVILLFASVLRAHFYPPSEALIAFPLWAFAGLLIHARWDFPFQMYSILFLFTLICAIPYSAFIVPQKSSSEKNSGRISVGACRTGVD